MLPSEVGIAVFLHWPRERQTHHSVVFAPREPEQPGGLGGELTCDMCVSDMGTAPNNEVY